MKIADVNQFVWTAIWYGEKMSISEKMFKSIINLIPENENCKWQNTMFCTIHFSSNRRSIS